MFGIKGSGPAGSVSLPTQEFENGQWVTITAQFRVYNTVAESIADHANLLATSGYYGAAMANRQAPNSFAQALTGVYATDPNYGNTLVGLMRRYNLYRFDPDTQSATAQARAAAHPASASAAQATAPQTASAPAGQAEIPGLVPAARRPSLRQRHRRRPRRAARSSRPPRPPGRSSRRRRNPRRRPRPSQSARRPRLRCLLRGPSPPKAPPYASTSRSVPPHAAVSRPRDSAAGGHDAGPGGPASTQAAGHRNCPHAGQPAPDRADARDGGRADGRAPGRRPIPRTRYRINRRGPSGSGRLAAPPVPVRPRAACPIPSPHHRPPRRPRRPHRPHHHPPHRRGRMKPRSPAFRPGRPARDRRQLTRRPG